ncbi:hypothetical protein CLV63_110184 [Murinocardiopsis flavida]|uniref:Uncharacterized protein n=1 Tax=Murinocardiopsis flavida TaxID=645275 RepID=A0A2P8DI41_9ACTN|nr:hypothetical protein [Murinocardiopsis flavida]PSK96885.1 hypothetical protein CLV63_110184 [Murinocardiopsis flavida]
MAGWLELAYTTGGGVIGAAVTTYVAGNQQRRELRAAVMAELHRMAAVRAALAEVAPRTGGRPAQYLVGPRLLATAELGVTARLDDGRDAEQVQQQVLADFVVAALSAGIPRRVLDFAGGAEVRALQCEVVGLVDRRDGGVLGARAAELAAAAEGYRQATAQLLFRALWHPLRSRPMRPAHIRALRREVGDLHRMQGAAITALARAADGTGND